MVDEVRKINSWLLKINVVERDSLFQFKKVPKDVTINQENMQSAMVHSKYKLP